MQTTTTQTCLKPEALTVITKVCNGVICTLGLAESSAKEFAAKTVIALAAQRSVLDIDELRAETIATLKLEGFRSAV
jgi:hypothetical protein